MDLNLRIEIRDPTFGFVVNCNHCEQPIIVSGTFFGILCEDEGISFILANRFPCIHCNHPITVPRMFDDSGLAAQYFWELAETAEKEGLKAISKMPVELIAGTAKITT